MAHVRYVIFTWKALVLLSLLAGCDLLATRTPENPINSGSQFEPATTPSIVLRNLENALNYANAGDYRKCFSDTTRGLRPYVFQPSIQGAAALPATFARWGPQEEEEYIRNIFAELEPGAVCAVTFTPSEVTGVPIGDSVEFSAAYTARFPHTREGAERECEGTLQFTMRLSKQNEWFITYWRDISKSDRPSWTLIKARFIDR